MNRGIDGHGRSFLIGGALHDRAVQFAAKLLTARSMRSIKHAAVSQAARVWFGQAVTLASSFSAFGVIEVVIRPQQPAL
jgi:hypothetical protein